MQANRFLQWMTTNTKSVYWADTAVRSEQLEGFLSGAVSMTTNPVLCAASLQGDRPFWEERLSKVPRGLKGDEKVMALLKCVTGFYAGEVRPIYEKDGALGKGYVCAQVNPSHTGDAEFMLEQAKAYATWAPNIVIKLPATRAGLEVQEECVALGYNVASTVSFTVPQVIEAAKARERGKKRAKANGVKPGIGIAVVMVGRLDDYLRDVAHDTKAAAREGDIISAGTACIKRAYGIFREEGWDTFLMPAGCRGAYHVLDLAGADMLMSIHPKIAKLLEPVDAFEEKIGEPVAKDVIDRLCTMPEFRKAYEPDGMSADEFVTFGSTNRTTAQFIECGWNVIAGFPY